jgi:hypothetical protein
VWLLIAFTVPLVIAVMIFTAVGLRQWRRRIRLAQKSGELGLRFSVDDPFDIPGRYAELALMGSGHSLTAENVTYGYMENRPVRAFDLHYEIGHGTRRLMRRYGGVLLQMPRALPELLVWRPSREWTLPMDCDERIGPWSYIGPRDLALAALEAGLADVPDGGCFQVRASVLLIGVPRERFSADYFGYLPTLRKIAEAMEDLCPAPGSSPGGTRESSVAAAEKQSVPAAGAKGFAKPPTA